MATPDETFTLGGVTYNIYDHSADEGITAAEMKKVIQNLYTTQSYKDELSDDMAAAGGQSSVVNVHIDNPDREGTGTFNPGDGTGTAINIQSDNFTDSAKNTYKGENGERVQQTVDTVFVHEVAHLHQERVGEDEDGDGIADPHDNTDSDGDGNPDNPMGGAETAEEEEYARIKANKVREELGETKREVQHSTANGEDLTGDGVVDEEDDLLAEALDEGKSILDSVRITGTLDVVDLDGSSGDGINFIPDGRYDPNFDPSGTQNPVRTDPVTLLGYAAEFVKDLGQLGAAAITGVVDAVQGALDGLLQTLAEAGAAALTSLGLADWFVNFWEATGDAEWMGSPLVLDLDGDGIELVSLVNSSVFWDIDEDGFLENTGWVGADDGMLAIDLNGDGIITDHTELFGSITEDGFTALAVYDTNGDGVMDANDAQFGDLLVWQDVNQNGFSEANELYTLADLNIVSIDLNSTNPYEMYIEGNKISDISSYTVDDGVSGPQNFEIVDAWYQYDNRNTEFVGDYTLDLNSLFITTVRGYGNLPDLHVSASMDNDTTDPNSLMSLLQDFSALSFDDLFADDRSVMDQVRGIMLRWAGADSVDPTSMGQWADAQELTFINALRGDQWLLFGNNPNPWAASSRGLQKAFEIALYAITSKLVSQAAGASLFNDGTYYNPATDAFVGFTSFNQDALDALVAKSLDATQVANKTEYWVQVVNMVDNSIGVSNLSTAEYSVLEATIQASDNTLTIVDLQDKIAKNIEDQLSSTPDGDFIYGTSADDVYAGSVGDDFYSGGNGDDTLSGSLGDDILHGNAGNDILDGGLGDDIVVGGNGDDTYLFFLGQGDDVVIEKGGNDKILFGPGITANDLSFIRVGAYDLTVQIDPTVGYGSIAIQGQFFGGVVETLEFDDGSTLDLTSLDYTYIGSSDNETIYGVRDGLGGSGVDTLYGNGGDDIIRGAGVSGYSYTAKNTIYGGDGNDTLYADRSGDYLDGGADNDVINGGGGVDTLIGGTGDDTLKGGTGDDTYIFNYGDGNDLIEENRDSDTILFGAGITAAMFDITRLNINDVIINIDGGLGGSIELNWQTYGTKYIVETVQFDDGSTLDLTSLDLTLNGTSAGETLYGVRFGGSGVDTIYGNGGNDIIYGFRGGVDYDNNFLYGGAGNDTIYGAHGVDLIYGDDGNDTIQGYNGNDTIYGGNGNDTLRGGNQDDVLYGDAGDDILFGDNNNDTLIGGLGIDQLTGGSGNDTFTFLSSSSFDNVDTITDFNATYDSIDISDLLQGYDQLTDAITDFVQITDSGSNSILSIDADGGADNFVQIATLNNVTGLTDEDALLTSGNLIAA